MLSILIDSDPAPSVPLDKMDIEPFPDFAHDDLFAPGTMIDGL